MLYEQKVNYQNIGGSGRDCSERWNIIKKHMIFDDPTTLTLDVGSAEGYFSYKIADELNGSVVSVEGSPAMITRQKKYNKSFIESDKVILHETVLTPELFTTEFIKVYNYFDYTLCLSVIHWFEDPDAMLKELATYSDTLFFEMPPLHDTKSYNQPFLKRIEEKYKTIDDYLKEITDMVIVEKVVVKTHMADDRTLYVLD
jgi:SAM-dependent methyltransferase